MDIIEYNGELVELSHSEGRNEMRVKASILIMLFFLTGCFAESTETPPGNKPDPVTIKLTPVELFKGDAAKFQLFLGSMSGAFKLTYEGKKPNASLDIDIWKDGRKADSAGFIGDLFHSTEESKSGHEVEVIISIDTVSLEGRDDYSTIKVCTVDQQGSSLSTFTIPWEKGLKARGLIKSAEPFSFTADQPVHVFGMHATSSNEIIMADLSPESLSRTEWALVFTLRFAE